MKNHLLFLIFLSLSSHASLDQTFIDYHNLKESALRLGLKEERLGNKKEAFSFFVYAYEFKIPTALEGIKRLLPLVGGDFLFELAQEKQKLKNKEMAFFLYTLSYELKHPKALKALDTLAPLVGKDFLYKLALEKEDLGKKEMAFVLHRYAFNLGESRSKNRILDLTPFLGNRHLQIGNILAPSNPKLALRHFVMAAERGFLEQAKKAIKKLPQTEYSKNALKEIDRILLASKFKKSGQKASHFENPNLRYQILKNSGFFDYELSHLSQAREYETLNLPRALYHISKATTRPGLEEEAIHTLRGFYQTEEVKQIIKELKEKINSRPQMLNIFFPLEDSLRIPSGEKFIRTGFRGRTPDFMKRQTSISFEDIKEAEKECKKASKED